MKTFVIILIIFSISKCNLNNKNTPEKMIKSKNDMIDSKQIDSLKNKGFLFTKEIDFFSLKVIDTVLSINDSSSYYAFKKLDNKISIQHLDNGKITLKRDIKKINSNFFKEERIIDSSDGGEIHYLTYYYSENKIIITIVTNSIFEDKKINCYLDELLIVNNKNVKQFSYKRGNKFHLTKDFLLSQNQLINIEKEALSLFYDKEHVDTSNYSFENLMKEVLYVWEINQLSKN
uniref:hypothetical protein n=1 Tax=Flavobacterium sp. TaxID=239 RepID=UPI0040476239